MNQVDMTKHSNTNKEFPRTYGKYFVKNDGKDKNRKNISTTEKNVFWLKTDKTIDSQKKSKQRRKLKKLLAKRKTGKLMKNMTHKQPITDFWQNPKLDKRKNIKRDPLANRSHEQSEKNKKLERNEGKN